MIFCWELRKFPVGSTYLSQIWFSTTKSRALDKGSSAPKLSVRVDPSWNRNYKYILISRFGLFKKALARGPCELIIPVYEHMYLSDDADLQVSLFLHEVFVLKNVKISSCFVANHNTQRHFSLDGWKS